MRSQVQAVALASTLERPVPVPCRLGPEGGDRVDVAGHGVVGEVSSHDAREPASLFGDRLDAGGA